MHVAHEWGFHSPRHMATALSKAEFLDAMEYVRVRDEAEEEAVREAREEQAKTWDAARRGPTGSPAPAPKGPTTRFTWPQQKAKD